MSNFRFFLRIIFLQLLVYFIINLGRLAWGRIILYSWRICEIRQKCCMVILSTFRNGIKFWKWDFRSHFSGLCQENEWTFLPHREIGFGKHVRLNRLELLKLFSPLIRHFRTFNRTARSQTNFKAFWAKPIFSDFCQLNWANYYDKDVTGAKFKIVKVQIII